MEDFMKKFDHLDDSTKRRIENFVSSKGVMSSDNTIHYKQKMENLENQINNMLKQGAL